MTERQIRLLEGWAVWVQYGLVPLALVPIPRQDPKPGQVALAECDAYEPKIRAIPDLRAWLSVECAVERCPREGRSTIRAYLRRAYIEMSPASIDGRLWARFEEELG